MNQMLELSAKDSKAVVAKILQQSITNCLKTSERKSQQRNRSYKNSEMEIIDLKDSISETLPGWAL